MPGIQQIFCDFDNGYIYRRVKKYNTYIRVGNKIPKGYLKFSLNNHKNKYIYVHRYLYEKYHNITLTKEQQINHKNHKVDDNRMCNLEVVSHQQNNQYKRKTTTNTSGFKGVCWTKREKKWRARIFVNGKEHSLGYFNNIEDAKNAWIRKAEELNQQGHKYFIEY